MDHVQQGAVVSVLFDFEYRASDGGNVQMLQDEQFLVVEKTNCDWWQVIRSGERKPFYAPTQYLRLASDQQESAVLSCRRGSLRDNRRAPLSVRDAEQHIRLAVSVDSMNDDSNATCADDRVTSTAATATPACRQEKEDSISGSHEPAANTSGSSLSVNEETRLLSDQHNDNHNDDDDERTMTASSGSAAAERSVLTRGVSSRRLRRRCEAVEDLCMTASTNLPTRAAPIPVTSSHDTLHRHYSTFSNLRSTRVDMAGHNASFKRTAQRLARPCHLPLSRTATAHNLRPVARTLVTCPANISSSHTALTNSCERLALNRPGVVVATTGGVTSVFPPVVPYFNNPLRRSALSRSVDQLPVPLSRSHSPMVGGMLQDPPVPHMLDTPVRQMCADWAEYRVSDTGRRFYYNSQSGVSTWKPPRRLPSSLSPLGDSATVECERQTSDESGVTDATSTVGPAVDAPDLDMPSGWRHRLASNGEPSYVNRWSPTPWFSSQDDEGLIYYYREGSADSHWTLPSHASQTTSISSHLDNSASTSGGDNNLAFQACSETSIDSAVATSGEQFSNCSLKASPEDGDTNPRDWNVSWTQFDDHDKQSILNQGTLNRTKVASETRRRVRKNWAACHVILTDTHLFLFKDTRSAANMQCGVSGSRPETSVDLSCAAISWQPDKSSRRNVFQITTDLGVQLLLQDDNATTAGAWYTAVHRAISRHRRASLCTVQSYNVQAAASIMPSALSHKLNRSRSTRVRGSTVTVDDDTARDSSYIRELLRKFFRSRPAADVLRKNGILRDEPVFGCHLNSLCRNADGEIGGNSRAVPRFMRECVGAIEARRDFMSADGLYRASGNLSKVQRLRCEVDQDNYEVLWRETDVHVLSGALKLFLRELKEPLVPFSAHSSALLVAECRDHSEQVAAVQALLDQLPDVNRQTLLFLLAHLVRVTALDSENRMYVHNLAIVFGPTLMWPEQDAAADLAINLMKQNHAVEAMLLCFPALCS